jgi:hypothetical protein
MKKLAVTALVFVVAAAFGATAHRITLDKPAVVNGRELKAGDYKLELDGEKVTISNKKTTVDATVRVETAGDKFRSTTVCCLSDGGKYNLQEIRLGGTNQKLVLGNDSASK